MLSGSHVNGTRKPYWRIKRRHAQVIEAVVVGQRRRAELDEGEQRAEQREQRGTCQQRAGIDPRGETARHIVAGEGGCLSFGWLSAQFNAGHIL